MDLDVVIMDNPNQTDVFESDLKKPHHINAHYNWRKLKSAHRAGAELSIHP